MKPGQVKKAVREGYARIARKRRSCCGAEDASTSLGRTIGYSEDDLRAVPAGADSFGCGNPIALASLKPGETVLDLGSGAGFDCFLAARKVGAQGKVIGVDMTPEMIARARANAEKGGYSNVQFRRGDIESLPLADRSVDVVISNCVINLSPDKAGVFREAFRVLKPGGRLMISDMVWTREPPASLRGSVEALVGCLAGALLKDDYLASIAAAGFEQVKSLGEAAFPEELLFSDPAVKALIEKLKIPDEVARGIARSAVSIRVQGRKPA